MNKTRTGAVMGIRKVALYLCFGQKPKSIHQLAKETEMGWESTKAYVELLVDLGYAQELIHKKRKNYRAFILGEKVLVIKDLFKHNCKEIKKEKKP